MTNLDDLVFSANDLKDTSTNERWQNYEKEHVQVSQFTVQNLLLDAGNIEPESAY